MKWGKYAKICVKMLKNRLFLADPLFLQHSLYLAPTRSKKYDRPQVSKNIYFFPLEQIFLESFSFTHGTFFLGHPVHISNIELA